VLGDLPENAKNSKKKRKARRRWTKRAMRGRMEEPRRGAKTVEGEGRRCKAAGENSLEKNTAHLGQGEDVPETKGLRRQGRSDAVSTRGRKALWE